jgi:hypothetical protein
VNLDGETNLKTRRPILNVPARQQTLDTTAAGNGNGNAAGRLDSISEANVPTSAGLQPAETTVQLATDEPGSDVDSASAVNVVGPELHHELDLKFAIQQVGRLMFYWAGQCKLHQL